MTASQYAIQALPTIYHGISYRSRLEARWAVFFANIGIVAHYEYQGFKLRDGTCCLPDFYLPDFGFIEIKPTVELAWTLEGELQALMCDDAPLPEMEKHNAIAITGTPSVDGHGALVWHETDSSMGFIEMHKATFTRCRKCESGLWLRDDEWGGTEMLVDCPCDSKNWDRWPIITDNLVNAYHAAASAKF